MQILLFLKVFLLGVAVSGYPAADPPRLLLSDGQFDLPGHQPPASLRQRQALLDPVSLYEPPDPQFLPARHQQPLEVAEFDIIFVFLHFFSLQLFPISP